MRFRDQSCEHILLLDIVPFRRDVRLTAQGNDNDFEDYSH